MNTEKLRELLRRIRPNSEVAPWVCEELAAIIAEEEAREPVGYISEAALLHIAKNDGILSRMEFPQNISLKENGVQTVPLYTQPPSAGGEG